MLKFGKKDSNNLKEFLYYSNIHDSKLKDIRYNGIDRTLYIETFNSIFKTGLNFTFCDVEFWLFVNAHETGHTDIINSLTLEDNCSIANKLTSKHTVALNDSIYLMFQMFSLDEMHIISNSVNVEIIQ